MRGGSDFDRVAELLDMLGGGRRGNQWSCPMPDHADHNPSCSTFRKSDGRTGWKCWSCNASGDLVDLLELAGADRKEALISAGVIEEDDQWDKKKRKKGGKQRSAGGHAPHPAEDLGIAAAEQQADPSDGAPYDDAPHPADDPAYAARVQPGPGARRPSGGPASQGTRRGPAQRSAANAPANAAADSGGQAGGKPGNTGQGRSSIVSRSELAELLRKPKRSKQRGRNRARVRAVRPEPKAEGVLLRPTDAAAVDAGQVFIDSLTGQQRRLFEDWVSLWPEDIVQGARIGSAIRQMAQKRLPVARVPLLDLTGAAAGWSDRVLIKDVERRWLYSRGLSVQCAGADRLACRTGLDNCDCEFCWDEVWLVEGHSDWLTGLTISEMGGAGIPVLGANGTSALPALAAIIAKKQIAYSLVVFADNDTAGAKAAAAARRAWLDYLPESQKDVCDEPLILSTPVDARKTDLTDLLKGGGQDSLIEVTFDALRRARRLGRDYAELSC